MENQSNSSAQNTSSNQYNASGQSSSGEKGNGFNIDSLTGMLGGANIPDMLKQYGSSASRAMSKLTTTQKVIGGALLVLGAGYLAKRSTGGWIKGLSGLAGAAGKKGKTVNGKNKH